MRTRFLFFVLFLLAPGFAFSQPALAWAQRYNGPPDLGDEAVSIAVDASGNSYVTGSAFATNGSLDMVTIKYNPAGQQLWLQSYNGNANDNDQANKIILDNAGNVYVIGYSKDTSSMQDMTTIKYNSSGVQQWVALYDGAFHNYDEATGIAVDASGNVYISGYETTPTYYYDFVTIKYNSAGVQQWAHTYDGPGQGNDECRDLGIDANGNVYVTGTSDSTFNSALNADIVLLKYNNNGVFQWKRKYDSPGHGFEYCKKLAVDRNNNIIVTGYGFISGNGNDYYIIKWDAAGNQQWVRNYNYGTNTFEVPAAIVTDSLNNIVVTGQGVTSTSLQTNDYVTVKYNAAGTLQWASRYDGGSNLEDRAYGLALDDSLNVYVTGFSKGNGTMMDIATVKYDPAGTQKFALRFDNVSKDDAGNSVAVNNSDIYVTGRSANLTNDDYVTLRYSYSAVGIVEQSGNVPSVGVFPNPVSDELHILVPTDMSLANAVYSVRIENALGQQVRNLIPAMGESTGAQSVLLVKTEGLQSGVYLLRVFTNNVESGNAKFMVK